MKGHCRIFQLTYMVTVAIPAFLAFNIDMRNCKVYSGEQKDFFGYRVLQFMSGTNKGIIVTAPLQLNGSGGICKLDQNKTTHCFNSEEISLKDTAIPIKHLGLSIAQDSIRSQFTVCSPSLVHECNENSYLNSVCYKMTDHLQKISTLTPAFQECTKKTVDLVFLFDGSGSMTTAEFDKNKDFIVDIMNSLKNTSIRFAAVQFSTDYRKVFDFSDYEAGTALGKLREESHFKDLTNTHKALKFVLEEILENPKAGASSDATKVLVLITDGDPSDTNRQKIVEKYDEKKIIRFVIGIKEAKLDKFKAIASEPKDQNAFKIENYNGLKGILENFQKKIFKMEGSDVARAGDLTNELSQSGFSTVFYRDTLILGSVGSNMWRGSLQELHGEKQTQIEDPQMKNDSYLGYSTSVGEKNNTTLYFTGAPRFEHTGMVVLFRYNGKSWSVAQRINGDQIGSYFGAELCSIDVNSDGSTDFLLVGAPLFFQLQDKREGQIYVYTLTDEMQLESELTVTAPSMGRFGTSIASLADLNGDGLRDVAVGAPLEDNDGGAVYIFLGDGHRGIRSTFSQRIIGQKIKPGLRFFGQAIDGDIDLGDDGLPDIVVGSKGTAVVLRSRPVFNVMAHLSFHPKEISTEKIDCLSNTDENLPVVNLTACFEMVETTKNKGAVSSGLNISYMLGVDPMRQTTRGFFSQTDKKSRNFTSTLQLKDKDTCLSYSIYVPKCVKDTLSPIIIKLNFAQVDVESASGVLNVDSKRQAFVEVPFEKQCRKNDTCIAELEVDFNFMTPTLLVKESNYFNISVRLSNHGDDSYNTSLSLHYPPGLSFSRMTFVEPVTRPVLHSCHDLEGVLDKTICGVSLPVYRSRSTAIFQTSFHIITEYEWNDTVLMTVTGNSDNTNSTRTNSLTKSIPVQFEIKMAITVKEGIVTYLNFTADDIAPKKLVTIFEIANLGFRAFPITVSLFFPTKLQHNFEMNNYEVVASENKTKCTRISEKRSEYCSPNKYCKVIECDSFILDKETEFTLSGDVQFKDLEQHVANIDIPKKYTGDSAEVKFKSFIHVRYDKQRYVLDSHKQEETSAESSLRKDPTIKWAEVQVEFIIFPNQQLIILTGAGLGFLLLIIITIIMIKLGCFKRKTLEHFEEQEEAALQATSNKEIVSESETNGKSVHPSEEKRLLDDGEANDTNLSANTEEGPD